MPEWRLSNTHFPHKVHHSLFVLKDTRQHFSVICQRGHLKHQTRGTRTLSWLSVQFQLRSWSHSLWVRAPHQALCWQCGSCSKNRLSKLPWPEKALRQRVMRISNMNPARQNSVCQRHRWDMNSICYTIIRDGLGETQSGNKFHPPAQTVLNEYSTHRYTG